PDERREPLSPIGVAPDWGDRRDTPLAVAVGGDVAAEQSRCRSQRRADRAMDHRTAGGLANRIDIELGKHDGEGRTPIAGGGDPLPYRRYEDTIEIGLGDRTCRRRRAAAPPRSRQGAQPVEPDPRRGSPRDTGGRTRSRGRSRWGGPSPLRRHKKERLPLEMARRVP